MNKINISFQFYVFEKKIKPETIGNKTSHEWLKHDGMFLRFVECADRDFS